MIYHRFLEMLNEDCFDNVMIELYGSSAETIARQKRRYAYALEKFHEYFPNREGISVFSAPGRTEIGGNHTDHQHGCILAAAVDLDIIAVVSLLVLCSAKEYLETMVRLEYTEEDLQERYRHLFLSKR